MRNSTFTSLAVAAMAVAPACLLSAESLRITVSAGDYERRDTVVTFELPEGARDSRALENADGKRIPLQVSKDGQAAFLLPYLEQGAKATFRLAGKAPTDNVSPWVEVVEDRGRLRFTVHGTPALYYQAEERPFPRPDINPVLKRGGFLHPVLSPSGRTVTASYPERHTHHQGIWSPWTRTRFQGRSPDFWNMHSETGKVEFEEIDKTWSGPVHGGFRSRHRFLDLSGDEPVVALNETWEVALYQTADAEREYRLFDLKSHQETATPDPLILVEHHYGGLGFRGHEDWVGEENTHFLTSEGETDRREGNGTRTRWTHISGDVDGERTGIAIFCHPDNFRFPQPVRLHPREPFFCYAPSQLGDWEITPDSPYTARYRFAVMDGEADATELERLWNDYANPPEVRIEN